MKKLAFGVLVCALFFIGCKEKSTETSDTEVNPYSVEVEETESPFFKISLAQWSLHKMVLEDGQDPLGFAGEAKALGFEAVEYVSALYTPHLDSLGVDGLIEAMKAEQEKHGVSCVLIMVDNEGDLADPNEEARDQAVENHKKWVDAAAALGGHSIRVNTFGTNEVKEWQPAVQDGLTKLAQYAATKNINVLIENHGWLSSDAPEVMKAIAAVNMENVGTLPDFGNWCVKRADGAKWGECLEEYPDYYQGIELMMAEAKAVSAKSYKFDTEGNETKLDYARMLQIVKDAGYTGHIGIEYEGDELTEKEGISATMNLLIKAAQTLN
ncbi:sugar phosphate isomerase/epimerase family protein [Aureitalea marina]|uniref:Xylose isomerase n=1 Tax=Aureitalea marina TaxID=930804 RepID=A0A2S7KRR1_9FLAO|nr:sugar phosphate isomerase/epimerase family protein [Aureitalea marina]PQB05314.1 xylose isomerase [Aureitalea marina]